MMVRGIKVRMQNMKINVIKGDQDVLNECILITDEFEAIPANRRQYNHIAFYGQYCS